MIPYGRQHIIEADIEAVNAVLRSDFLTQGPVVPRFEEEVAKYCSASNAVAVNSATSALHIACLSLGLGPGDVLWTSPITFVASANCALYCGAEVDFVDIDPITYNISVSALAEKLAAAENIGRLPKIVVPVHFAGQPCDMPAIHSLAQKYGFKIIEDASHAIGSSYYDYIGKIPKDTGSIGARSSNYNEASTTLSEKQQRSCEQLEQIKVGSCKHSDITVFSFHPVKIITAAEGGMALTNNEDLLSRMRLLRTHGITNDEVTMSPRSCDEVWNYQQICLGFNYRMTDVHAALGLSQMHRLDRYIGIRHEIAERYNSELSSLPVVTPWQSHGARSSYHLYPIRIANSNGGVGQSCVYRFLLANGVGANVHYIPVHRHPYYERFGFKQGDFPNAEKFYRQVISLPIHPSLSLDQQKYVCQVLEKVLGK